MFVCLCAHAFGGHINISDNCDYISNNVVFCCVFSFAAGFVGLFAVVVIVQTFYNALFNQQHSYNCLYTYILIYKCMFYILIHKLSECFVSNEGPNSYFIHLHSFMPLSVTILNYLTIHKLRIVNNV